MASWQPQCGVNAARLMRSAAKISHVRWLVGDINAEVRRGTMRMRRRSTRLVCLLCTTLPVLQGPGFSLVVIYEATFDCPSVYDSRGLITRYHQGANSATGRLQVGIWTSPCCSRASWSPPRNENEQGFGQLSAARPNCNLALANCAILRRGTSLSLR